MMDSADGNNGKSLEETEPRSSGIKPTYSVVRANIIRITPESMQCKLYCRGTACKYCTPTGWSEEEQCLRGLYSCWVTNEILAMARPTQTTFQQYDFIKQLRQNNIRTIFNLQCLNEHAFCGPPLLLSGFSYDPEIIMRNKIYYYNFAIPDFGVANISYLLDILKVMWFALRQGRIAVHCHAGLGRTCTLIACYLVWSTCCTAEQAILAVRSKRERAIQSPQQILLVEQLASVMEKLACALPLETGLLLTEYIAKQNEFIASDEVRKFTHIPKVIFLICDRLLRLIFDGAIRYKVAANEETHNVHSCTLGQIEVDWRNAYNTKGRAQTRYVVNIFLRLTAFPFDRDENVQYKFQHEVTVVNVGEVLEQLDASQLISLMNYYIEAIKRPFCSKAELISCLEHFAPDNGSKSGESEEPGSTRVSSSDKAPAPVVLPKCNAAWKCLALYLCNVLSYLIGENYEVVVELLTTWLGNENDKDVKVAVHNHMRDLFARNLGEQEQQSRRRNSLAKP